MKSYIARVLVEHKLTPEPLNYSSFSELIILGRFDLPKDLEFSTLLFDGHSDIIEDILFNISKKMNDEYLNANGERVYIMVRELSKIEDVNLEFFVDDDVCEMDERLFTFDEKLSFEDFKKLYYVGSCSD